MRRASFDDSRDSGTQREYAPEKMACTVCGKFVLRDELGAFGSRCRACFTGYCNELNRDIGATHTREDKLEILAWLRSIFADQRSPKSWAHRLRELEEAGQYVGPLQRRMWRAALHSAPSEASDVD